MNKRITWWLQKLPPKYAERALANYDGETKEAPSLKMALFLAFMWKDSPEGWLWWEAVYKWADYKQRLPDLPKFIPVASQPCALPNSVSYKRTQRLTDIS